MVFDSYLDQRQKKNHNNKVWFVLYMQPKMFWSHTCPKPSNISSGVSCGKGSHRKNVIFTLTSWVLYKCYDLKPFLVSCNILGNELTLSRNPNLNYQPKPVFGFNFLMSACRIKGQARKICTTLTNMVGGWKYFWKKKWWSQPNTNGNQIFF